MGIGWYVQYDFGFDKLTVNKFINLANVLFLYSSVTAASSTPEQVGQTYVRIKMKLQTGKETENIVIEMQIPQFLDFLHQLEKTQNSINQNNKTW